MRNRRMWILTTAFLIILLSYSIINLNNFKSAEEQYSKRIIDAFSKEINKAASLSDSLANNWEKSDVDAVSATITSIRMSLKQAELSAQLLEPHFNIKTDKSNNSLSFISDLFRIYELQLSEWQTQLLGLSDSGKLSEAGIALRDKIEILSQDLEKLDSINKYEIFDYSYDQLVRYWDDMVKSLKTENLIQQ